MNTVKITRGKRPARRGYHHGDLRAALVAAAEALVVERGVDGFTLREAARRAGVSPAAPAHHFKDMRGLLTEVALLGFRDFADALEEADRRGGADPLLRLREQGAAYVAFALQFPGRFLLMFRHDKHDKDSAEFVAEARRAYRVLEDAVRAATGVAPGAALAADGRGFLLATWSIVHGFAHLALGGELGQAPETKKGRGAILETLLPAMLQHLPRLK
ncbi:TetR/AcrR family transcriptional regulator [Dongia sp.]|uniref:TetR/AcrR family transcriptional regulator n=1 Tax=Dongia sp. TaxID=1977262 RepID=UPI003751830D